MKYANFHVFRVFAHVGQNAAFFEPGPGSRPLAQFSYRRKLVCRGGKEGGGGVATTPAVKEERNKEETHRTLPPLAKARR